MLSLLSVTGNSKIMHCGILINMPYSSLCNGRKYVHITSVFYVDTYTGIVHKIVFHRRTVNELSVAYHWCFCWASALWAHDFDHCSLFRTMIVSTLSTCIDIHCSVLCCINV